MHQPKRQLPQPETSKRVRALQVKKMAEKPYFDVDIPDRFVNKIKRKRK